MSKNKLSNKFHLLLLGVPILNFFNFFLLLYNLHSLRVLSVFDRNYQIAGSVAEKEPITACSQCQSTVPVTLWVILIYILLYNNCFLIGLSPRIPRNPGTEISIQFPIFGTPQKLEKLTFPNPQKLYRYSPCISQYTY